MKLTNYFLTAALLLSSTAAFAANDIQNKKSVDIIKAYVFGDDAATSVKLEQTGKSGSGSSCTLKVEANRFGLRFSLKAGKGEQAWFRASHSSKVSTEFQIEDSDANFVKASQVLVATDSNGTSNVKFSQFITIINSEFTDRDNGISAIHIKNGERDVACTFDLKK